MGYNSNAVTAIRETGRMLGGIVEAIERDAEFYYGGELLLKRIFWLLLTMARMPTATNVSDVFPVAYAVPTHSDSATEDITYNDGERATSNS